MSEVTMPRLSDTMEEGTIGRWLKQPGEQVEKGEIIAEIETDKATMELEAFESGTLQKIVVNEGQTVPIGEVIAFIGDGAAAPQPEQKAANGGASTPAQPTASEQETRTPELQGDGQNGYIPGQRIKASPVARRLALELGIDLRQVEGTGPGGRIIKENIEAFQERGGATPPQPAARPAPALSPSPAPERTPAPAPERTPAPPPERARTPTPAPAARGTVVPMTRMRRAIARAMTEAKPGYPHIYITSEVDMAEALKLRKEINDSGAAPIKISVNDMLVKAAAKALAKFPMVNSSYATGSDGQPGVITHEHINVGVAISLDEGLIAPPVVDADKKSLSTIAAEIRDMAGRAREGKIKQDELEGATFTVSNLGMYDVFEFGAVITPPQAAVLAVGSVRKVPVVRDDEIVVGEILYLTLSSDHRVVDGTISAQYLQEVKRLLQAPMSLLV